MEKRQKTGLALMQKHIKLCDDNLSRANARSRNEFVEKAIEFYAGYLNAEQNPLLFTEMFNAFAEKRMDTLSKTLGTGQYKIAVELSKLANIVAASFEIAEEDVRRLHKRCSEEVLRLGSVPDFQQAYRLQRER